MGVHAFFVPLRDVTTHQPLPGITLGDIGPKLGFNSVDNGFASFHHHAVPRLNLLGGVAVVHPDGSYERVRGGEKRM
jgi:alkylation response protein AidB-like acyl-CoA dehydrogenase